MLYLTKVVRLVRLVLFDKISRLVVSRLVVSVFLLCRLELPSLREPIREQYTKVLLQFGKEIDHTTKIYQKHKNEPPTGRDLPPIAGKIAWARQLYRRIQEPMDAFKIHPTILKDPDAKKIIKSYNKAATVLVEFECLYYQAWSKQVCCCVFDAHE